MKHLLAFALCSLFCATGLAQQKNKLQQDREAILAFAGCYKVTFEFGETFAPDTAYKYHDRKFDWGIEQVSIVENTEKKIVLQHLLIVNDTLIIKHWRQDWVYENTDLLSYVKDNEWKKVKLTPAQAKGTWTQKVFQVDDSPRYEGYGTWVHVDGRHFWESTADAPLPRREITKRQDYNVMKRHSHVETTDYGWVFEQDNEKIIRSESGDKLLCWEKGMEKFLKGAYDCKPGVDWWTKNQAYWADVRAVWSEIYAQPASLKLEKRIDEKFLFEKLFAAGDEWVKKTYNTTEAKAEIKKIITAYLKK